MTRVLICGCRWFGDRKSIMESHQYRQVDYLLAMHRKFFWDACDLLLGDVEVSAIISGMAPGADTLAVEWAKRKGYPIDPYAAKWRVNGVYNPKAGIERNGVMVAQADQVIAFWDLVSRGTKNSVERTEKCGKPLDIVDIRRFNL